MELDPNKIDDGVLKNVRVPLCAVKRC
jgi:hypothetical protein